VADSGAPPRAELNQQISTVGFSAGCVRISASAGSINTRREIFLKLCRRLPGITHDGNIRFLKETNDLKHYEKLDLSFARSRRPCRRRQSKSFRVTTYNVENYLDDTTSRCCVKSAEVKPNPCRGLLTQSRNQTETPSTQRRRGRRESQSFFFNHG
jgi:hypothetical protein